MLIFFTLCRPNFHLILCTIVFTLNLFLFLLYFIVSLSIQYLRWWRNVCDSHLFLFSQIMKSLILCLLNLSFSSSCFTLNLRQFKLLLSLRKLCNDWTVNYTVAASCASPREPRSSEGKSYEMPLERIDI